MYRLVCLFLAAAMPVFGLDVVGFYFTGSYLYWKAAFSDLTIASFEQLTDPAGARELLHLKNLKFPYVSGFKAGAGYGFCGNDVYVNWTHLNNSPHLCLRENETRIVQSITSEDIFNTSGVKAHGDTRLDVGDLEFGKLFYANYLFVRPFAGLKAAWLNYSYFADFSDASTMQGQPIFDLADRFRDHLWGIGPRIGFNSRWHLGSSGFAVLFNAATSLLWEEFHPRFSSTYVEEEHPHGGIVESRFSSINPVSEFFVGLSYTAYLQGFFISAAAGYEMQHWCNQMPTLLIFSPSRSFDIQGLTASLRVGF